MSEEDKLLKEAKKLPWEDRLFHKNWKVRNEANIDLASLCDSISDPKDPRIREFGHLFKKTVSDSNAPVQEKALDALLAYLRAADADVGRYGKEVCEAVVAKCLTGRTKTVEKAQAVFMLWVELEAVDAFLDSMEKAIKNKVAKAVVPAIDVMFQALSEFGAKIVPPKRLLKMLPELFDHPDQNVRASSKGLTLELCRWIGKDHVKVILFEKMRDTMLEAELVNVTGTAKPSRKISEVFFSFLCSLVHACDVMPSCNAFVYLLKLSISVICREYVRLVHLDSILFFWFSIMCSSPKNNS
ncbi:putative TOG domain-containing protein [Lupinus albus]|uniref:Putative TOG domain-containing protein n=1 Tax=Lupinus albus TaxID=3870 RepID=A0A6A4NK29_LUPAL|nr:putative TOG domain-containing protein [Lupinus albus]